MPFEIIDAHMHPFLRPETVICNYDLKPGYAGVENPIYKREKGVYLCLGDAKESLMKIINEI